MIRKIKIQEFGNVYKVIYYDYYGNGKRDYKYMIFMLTKFSILNCFYNKITKNKTKKYQEQYTYDFIVCKNSKNNKKDKNKQIKNKHKFWNFFTFNNKKPTNTSNNKINTQKNNPPQHNYKKDILTSMVNQIKLTLAFMLLFLVFNQIFQQIIIVSIIAGILTVIFMLLFYFYFACILLISNKNIKVEKE